MAEVVCLGLLVADVFGSPLEALPSAGDLSLIDRYVTGVGGCAANTAADLTRLGRTARVLGKVGEDPLGHYVLEELKAKGIDTISVAVSKAHQTSFTFILNVQGQDRRYIHCAGANAGFSPADIDLAALDGARALYVGGFLALAAFRPQDLLNLFCVAKKRGLMTVLDVVIPAGTGPAIGDLREALAYTDVFLPNTDEARVLTARTDPVEQAKVLGEVCPDSTAVITLGGAGVVIQRGGQTWRAGAYQVKSIDESGSGDAFGAGYLVGLLEGWPWEATVRFASAVGASCVRALGCHDGVFTFDEARAFIEEHQLKLERIS